jgi:hypothetical protein
VIPRALALLVGLVVLAQAVVVAHVDPLVLVGGLTG